MKNVTKIVVNVFIMRALIDNYNKLFKLAVICNDVVRQYTSALNCYVDNLQYHPNYPGKQTKPGARESNSTRKNAVSFHVTTARMGEWYLGTICAKTLARID